MIEGMEGFDLTGSLLGLALCCCAGVSGAFAAVCGKLAGGESGVTQAAFYTLLVGVSGGWGRLTQ